MNIQIIRFSQKKTPAFDVSFGTNVEQGMLFRMTSRKILIVPKNLEIFHFSLVFDIESLSSKCERFSISKTKENKSETKGC